MSDMCGNCDCADKSQCVKKGNQFGMEVVQPDNYAEGSVMYVEAAENDGKCKCGSSCGCSNCTCGCH